MMEGGERIKLALTLAGCLGILACKDKDPICDGQCGGYGALISVKTVAETASSPSSTSASTSSTGSTSSASSSSGSAMGDWIPLPGIENIKGCEGGVQLKDPSTWPKPNWQACGEGCAVANALDAPGANNGRIYHSAVEAVGNDLYYRVEEDASPYNFQVLRRRADDQAVSVLRISQATCATALNKDGAPLMSEFFGTPVAQDWVGVYHTDTATLVPPSVFPNFSGPSNWWFTWSGGWGAIRGQTDIQLVLDSNPTATLDAFFDGSTLDYGRARNGQVTWADWGTFPTKVRSWTEGGGQQVLFQAPNDIGGMALSDTTMAFVNVTGPNTQMGAFVTASVDWLPLTSEPASVQITVGPDITGEVSSLVPIATAGDFIAIGVVPPSSIPSMWGVMVVQMSTQKKWLISAPTGSYLELAGLSSTEVLAYEGDGPPSPTYQDGTLFTRWKRFDLTQLSSFATEVP